MEDSIVIKHGLFISLVFLLSNLSEAQVYPVQVTTQVTPPYSLYLADYVAPGSERLALHILLRDVARPELDVKLRLRIIGQGITIETKPEFVPSPISLQGGVSHRLIGTDIAEYFESRNLNFSGISQREYEQRGALPEGLYQFCFEVLEYNRGVKISNTGCTTAWLILNDPPLVNLPKDNSKVRAQDPQQVVFQWTPRHTGSPNAAFTTEYEFRLVELWPENRNPNDAILTSPVIFETTTRATTLVYGPAETPLEIGRRYAFQITAKSIAGVEELNLFKNNGRTQVFTFQYGDQCTLPGNIFAQATGSSRFKATWDPFFNQTAWTIRYRAKIANAEWFTSTSTLPELEVSSLLPATTYEYQVMATCGPFQSVFSPVAVVTTKDVPVASYSCGLPPDNFNLDPSQLLPSLNKGDVINAGDFDVTVTKATGGNGTFSGEGAIVVPFFNQVKAKVVFDNIKVNNEHRLVTGTMNVTGGGVEVIPAGVMNLMDKLEEGLNILDSALTIADNLIPDNPPNPASFVADSLIEVAAGITTVYRDATTGSVIVVAADGTQKTLAPGENYALKDDKGNGYLVDKKGEVTHTTASAATAAAKREYNLKLSFAAAPGMLYGLDSYLRETPALATQYETMSGSYSVAWKAIRANATDAVIAKIDDSKVDLSQTKFESGGSALSTTPGQASGSRQLTLTGKTDGTVDEVFAKFTPADASAKEQILGKLNVVSYDQKSFTLKIVPVNNNSYPFEIENLKRELKNIYSQAVVDWEVKLEPNLQVTGISDPFDDGESGLLSNYTDEMKTVINTYLDKHSLETDTYYLFLLSNPKSASKLGYMPRKKQAGFIFLKPHGSNEESLTTTVAHELGHGAFHLQHMWEEYSGISQNETDNLMDYANGRRLLKLQWDKIHNPEAVLGLFESDEDAAKFDCPMWFSGECEDVGEILELIRDLATNGKKIITRAPKNPTRKELIAENIELNDTEFKKIRIINLVESGQEFTYNPRDYEEYSQPYLTAEGKSDDQRGFIYRSSPTKTNPNTAIPTVSPIIVKILLYDDERNFAEKIKALKKYLYGDIPTAIMAEILSAFKSEVLTPNEIKDVRDLIDRVSDEEKRKEFYLELQAKVPYHNQRNNDQTQDIADRMCNLTSESMCFEYLGITCPNSEMQFEDYLEDVRQDNNYGERTSQDTRKQIAEKMGVCYSNETFGGTFSEEKEGLVKFIKPKLQSGCGVMLSVWPACKGHLVRVQDITDEGLIIDDPFGKVTDFKKREDCGKGGYDSNSKTEEVSKGKDNLWKWDDVEDITVKYIEVYCKCN